MKKKLVVSLVLLVIVGGVFAYYQHKQTKMHDFMTYYNEKWIPITAEKHAKMNDTLDKVEEWEEEGQLQKAANYMREKALPPAEEGLKQFEAIDPKNSEIKKVNQLTIEMEKQRVRLVKTVIAYSEDEQVEAAIQSDEEKLYDKADKVADYSQKLIKKYNLKKDETDKIGGFKKVSLE